MEEYKKNQMAAQWADDDDNPLAKLDLRVIYLDMTKRLWYIAIIFVCVAVVAFVVSKHMFSKSMKRWNASAQLYHQMMSEKIPTFYKQVNTRVIMELARGNGVFNKAVDKLKLPGNQAAVIRNQVAIEIPRNQPNIIYIRATFNNAKIVSDLVNAMADATLEAYIEMQNGTLKNIVEDRQKRRLALMGQLATLDNSLASYAATDSYLMPDKDLERLSDEIVLTMNEISRSEVEITKLTKKITDMSQVLAGMPENYIEEKQTKPPEYSLTEDNTALALLAQRYTPAHPLFKRKDEEVKAHRKVIEEELKKFQPASEKFIKRNGTREDLFYIDIMNKLELESLKVALLHHHKQLDDLRSKVAARQSTSTAYNETVRNIESLKRNIAALEVTINDNESLLNTAVPDLSILNYSTVPKFPKSMRKYMMLITGASASASAGGIALLAMLYGIVFGTLKCPKDFQLGPNISCLGMIPKKDEVTVKEFSATLHQAYHRLQAMRGEKQRLFLAELSLTQMTDTVKKQWIENFGTNGINVFVLKCFPMDAKTNVAPMTSPKAQEIDNSLLYVEKHGSHGIFFSENPLVLNNTELELLMSDLKQLENAYDLIIIERGNPGRTSDAIFGQLCMLSGYTVVVTTFGKDSKSWLKTMIADESAPECQFGGLLTDVPKKYWKLLKS